MMAHRLLFVARIDRANLWAAGRDGALGAPARHRNRLSLLAQRVPQVTGREYTRNSRDCESPTESSVICRLVGAC
jgi:hypothetical protein